MDENTAREYANRMGMVASENKAKLYKKLVNILKAVDSVPKNGYNKHQNYHYATEADVMSVIREQLIKQNLFVFTSAEVKQVDTLKKEDKTSFITTVTTQHVIVDADTGESQTVLSTGQGHDSLDKGVFKAITGANKYFLQKTFMISGEDDPESDGVTTPVPTRTSFANKTTGTTVQAAPATPPKAATINTPGAVTVSTTKTATVTPIKQETPVAKPVATTAPVRRSFSRAPVQAAPVQETQSEEPAEVGTNADDVVETSDENVRF